MVLGTQLFTLATLAVYGLHRFALLLHFRWSRATGSTSPQGRASTPKVTVQLPLFNERTVAASSIQAAAALDWPKAALELQVLDDSTDETYALVDAEVAQLQNAGFLANVVRRADRVGFKAGALDLGMGRTDADFFCVFDADFVPEPDFLKRTMGGFDDPRIGMVQARWGHLNRDESWLTRAQSTLLDGHFVVEHKVRFDRGLYFNFNGTAGIWRRQTIEDAGGWQHDTLTEDLDLSYRAQLAGWRFRYASDVVAPAEVPASIAAFKSQQHRWAKGSVQVYRKLFSRILSSSVPTRVKLEALLHLTGNVGYPLVLLLALLIPLTLPMASALPTWVHVLALLVCTLPVVVFYDSSQRVLGRTVRQRLRDVPSAIALGIGLSVSQTRAVWQGLAKQTGEFVRTPKRGQAPATSGYSIKLSGLPGIELVFAAWSAWSVIEALRLGLWGTLPFLMLFVVGFGWVGVLSLRGAFATPGTR